MKPTFLNKVAPNQGKPSLKRLAHEHLAGVEAGRSHKHVHASDLMKPGAWMKGTDEFCPREFALYDVTGKQPKGMFVSTSMRTTFKFGYLIQNFVVKLFADMDVAVTDWICIHCGHRYFLTKRPHLCMECNHGKFRDAEHLFKSKISDVVGGVDMFAQFPGANKLYYPVEIKSITNDDFRTLKAPMAEHRWRTNLYMRIIEESGDEQASLINTQEAIVFYVAKGGWGVADMEVKSWGISDAAFSPYKEYFIKRDDVATDIKVHHAVRLKQFRAGEKGIPLGVCPSSVCPRAKSCPVQPECFSGKYPGVE